MEQLRVVQKFMSQHGFWVICGVVMVASLGTWIWASRSMASLADNNRSKIDALYKKVQNVQTSGHPNDHSRVGMEAKIGRREQQVYDAWKQQADHQSVALVWPEKLQTEFPQVCEMLQGFRPVEKYAQSNVPIAFRVAYREHIEQLLSQLAESIKSEWNLSASTSPVGPSGPDHGGQPAPPASGGGPSVPAKNIVVQWLSENQQELWRSHFEWKDQQNGIPTSEQLLYAQEDLWVLESVMGVIQQTNGKVRARYSAAVKTIKAIRLGKNVPGLGGKLELASNAPATENRRGPSTVGHGPPGGAAPGDDANPSSSSSAVSPAENRYVSVEFKHLPASSLKPVTSLQNLEQAKQALAKRMPIEMELVMDQRKINKFLVECGNSVLPIEVRQVRVNPESGRGSRTTGPSSGGHSGGTSPVDVSENDVPVTIVGLVYLYNPPDAKLLNIQIPATPPATPASNAAASNQNRGASVN